MCIRDRLTTRLQTWLAMDYDCTLHEMQVTLEEEQAFTDADEDDHERLLRRFAAIADRDKRASLEFVAETLSNEKGERFSERQLRKIRDEVRRETGKTIWPNRRRGPRGKRTR